MQTVIAGSATRASTRAPWRTFLFVTASAIALASAPPRAEANNECGLPVAGVVTCAVDAAGPNYPDGITYNAAEDRTINVDSGVSIIGDAGLTLSNTAGNGVVSAPGVTLDSAANGIVVTNFGSGTSTATAAGDITAAGQLGVNTTTWGAGAASTTYGPGALTMGADNAIGVSALTFGAGGATGDSSGTISMTGEGSIGMVVLGGTGSASATSTGSITTEGADGHGLVAIARGPVTVDAGDITTTGENTTGVIAVSTRDVVDITVNGSVQGGWVAPEPEPEPVDSSASSSNSSLTSGEYGSLPFAAGIAAAAPSYETGALTITNNGAVGALSDLAIIGYAPTVTVDNASNVTGYVLLFGDSVTFNNTASDSFDIRNFADTNGDGVRDTEGVAISDFGGAGVFNNDAGGAVNLLTVSGATTIDTTGALVPEYGDPATYDITLEGVEQGQLTNLMQFNNAGSIVLQDALTGGEGPVAGDVLAILGSEGNYGHGDYEEYEPTLATFVSDGGSLWLDTVLNEGGAATNSDVLILDAVSLGSGPTSVFIANAGGEGAQTVDNGILLVDVLNPEASAANAFTLGSDPLIVGAFQYQLFQGGDSDAGGDPLDGNWYLRSDLAPTTDFYRGMPASMLRFGRDTIGSLQQRVGNRWWRVPERQTERTVTDPPPPPPPAATCPTADFVVYFEWDVYELNSAAHDTINAALQRARQCSVSQVTVIGHTDTSGSAEYNMGLSERRAGVVQGALVAGGIPAGAIRTEARGETDLARPTGDGVREPLNRRAAVTIRVSAPQVAAGPPPAPRTRTVVETIPATVNIQGSGVWGRIQGTDGEFESDSESGNVVSADESTWLAQFGVDFVLSQNDDGTVIGTVFAQYGEIDTDVSNVNFGEIGSLESSGYGIGGGVTWYSPGGAYADTQISFNWLDNDLASDTLGDLSSDGLDGTVWAVSLEGGYRHEMSPNYYVVPQGQLIYADADFDSFTDPFGADVDIDDGDSLVGRLGVAFEYQSLPQEDAASRLSAYALANVYYEFMGDSGVSVDGIDLQDENDETWGEIAGGLTFLINESWSVYGEAGYLSSLENWGDSHVMKGSLGVRYNW